MPREFGDYSNNQAEHINFVIYRAHSRLVGLKATEGTRFVDKTHGPRCDEAHKAGVRVAHYAFARPEYSATAEADLFWKTVKPHFKRKDYLVLDIEVQDTVAFAAIVKWVEAFALHIKRISGHSVVGYSGESFLQSLGSDCGVKRWWIAAYRDREPAVSFIKRPWAWQYTDGTDGPSPHLIPGGPVGDVSRLNHASWVWLHRP